MRNQVFKKLFSVLLALIMVAGLLPASVLAEGEGNAETTTVPTETVQLTEPAEPTEPAKTETPEEPAATPAATEAPEPTPENPAATDEPDAEPTPAADPTEEITIAPVSEVAAQAATEISYVKKDGNGKRLEDETFYRIFLLDCGRKYFTVDEIKGIIKLLANNHYTHIELAFGNEGLRLLLNENDTLSFKNNGEVIEKTGKEVNEAIQYGNDQLDSAASYTPGEKEELTMAEMSEIIAYAKERGIGVIPLFNAPGHMYTVVKAMEKLGLNANSITVENAGGGKTANVAIDPTNANAVYFVQALMQKYVVYFRDEGCKFFNVGADESGINASNYSAYAMLVNSHAAMVQNAGMVAMAFNDGIYNPAYISSLGGVEFDNNIVISYWTYSDYATAESLAYKGFIINSTHNNWYYILGLNNFRWAGYNTAYDAMQATKCNSVDSGYTTKHGCTFAVWCDTPSQSYSDQNKTNVETLIKRFATQNPTYFKAEEVKVTVSDGNKTVKEATKNADSTYKVVLHKATEGTAAESQTLQLTVTNGAEGATYTWTSSDDKIATVNENGLVTFIGAKGTVIITAKDANGVEKTITFVVALEGEVELTPKTIYVTVGGTKTDVIEGYNYNGQVKDTDNTNIAKVTSVVGQNNTTATTEKVTSKTQLKAGKKYLIYNVRSKATLTSETATRTSPSANGLRLNGSITASNSNWWEIVEVNGKYTINYKGGSAYLITGASSASVTSTQTELDIAYSESGEYWNISYNGYYLNHFGGSGRVAAGWAGSQNEDAASDEGSRWEIYEIVEAGESTTVTFEGVAEGTTYVTIGHVRYTINVTKEDLSNAKDFYIQLWFTNTTIEMVTAGNGVTHTTTKTTDTWHNPSGYTASDIRANYITIKADEAYGEGGIAISDLVPREITRYEEGGTYWVDKQGNKAPTTLILMKGKALPSTSRQYIWNTDRCNNESTGEYTYQYVRYLGGKWEVSNDRETWNEIATWVQNTKSESGYQMIIYYKQRTQVVDEIYTEIQDWPTIPHTDLKNGFILLDYRVVYGSGKITPTSFPQTNKTMSFACGSGVQNSTTDSNGVYYRTINAVDATAKTGVEIYMVTLTRTSDTPSVQVASSAAGATSYTYAGTEKVIWVDDEKNLPSQFRTDEAKYTSISGSENLNYRVGGTPNLDAVEIYYNQGLLVTYYIKATVTEDSLKVHYVNDTNGHEFYAYDISVKSGTYFDEEFKQVKKNSTELEGNTVTNILDVVETVHAELENVPKIAAQYRFGNYTCVRVERRDDKNVYLYYTFNSTKTFVVDFGIPLKISPADIAPSLQAANIKQVNVNNSKYANITTNNDDFSIIYTLTQMIDGKDDITVTYTGINQTTGTAGNATYTVTIIPAANVYYEDSFAKFTNGSYVDGENSTAIEWTTEKKGTVQTAETTQALETLGQTDHNPYGYDPAYNNCTTFSMGSAQKVTVTQAMATGWTDGSAWPTAQFTFKGTGFDIISLTDNTSGAIFVDVYAGKEAKGTMIKSYIVDNYYGYKKDGDNWVVDKDNANALYQIPVMQVRNLTYGEYTAVVTVFYDKAFNHTAKSEYSFWLDAVRVYDPMGVDNDIYNTGNEKEGFPQYIKLRDAVANKDATLDGSKALFIDGGNTADIATYANIGPNNEVYLANGQAITFKLTGDNLSKIATVQIGAKSPNSDKTNKANMAIGSTEEQLNTATEMYYDITTVAVENGSAKLVTITNTGDAILSLTNLKITYVEGNQTVALGEVSAEQQTQAVQAVRALFAPAPVEPEPEPEPEKTFEPDRFEASWSRNVMQGRKATLTVKTSEDVEAITVDGQTIRSYRIRTERVGFGRRAKRIMYREFTYSMVAQETADFSVTAINAEGTESEAITARLTVQKRPGSIRDVWNWFKGWF